MNFSILSFLKARIIMNLKEVRGNIFNFGSGIRNVRRLNETHYEKTLAEYEMRTHISRKNRMNVSALYQHISETVHSDIIPNVYF